MIASISHVKEVLKDQRAKKKFGQNFLIDANTVDKIARNACEKDVKTIEIGPGLGALAEMLLKYSRDVDAYEIDKDMVAILEATFEDERLKIISGDFLDADLSIYEEKVNVCANLPYYVTTPILFKLFESELDIGKITVMVQKEVGDRLNAKPGSEDYSALSVEVQYLYDVKLEMNISRSVFYPMPNVDSAVISFAPKRERDRSFEAKFFELVKNCFRMRRKTLYNNLKDLCDAGKLEEVYEKTGLRQDIRAQQLTLEDFLKLYEVIAQ